MLDTKRLLEGIGGANALIISPSNTYYAADYESTFAYVLVTENETFYLTDSRYTNEASTKIKNMKVVEVTYQNVYDTILDLVDKRLPLYYDEDIPYKEYMLLTSSLASLTLRPLGDRVLRMREVKSEEEISRIMRAQAIAEQSLSELFPKIKEGMTELECVAELEYLMKINGGDRLSFETIVAFGKNTASPHAHPGTTRLKAGDFITIDFGTTVEGYHGDMTRTMAFGEPTSEMRRVYDIVETAGRMAIDEVMAGKNCNAVDAVARDYIASFGFGKAFGHGLGHSVGIDIHEDPRLSPTCDQLLVENNVVTVEPGIYIPDEFGLRIEDIIIVKDNNQIDINNLTRELIIL